LVGTDPGGSYWSALPTRLTGNAKMHRKATEQLQGGGRRARGSSTTGFRQVARHGWGRMGGDRVFLLNQTLVGVLRYIGGCKPSSVSIYNRLI
jgi:hypothetical protein